MYAHILKMSKICPSISSKAQYKYKCYKNCKIRVYYEHIPGLAWTIDGGRLSCKDNFEECRELWPKES